MKEEIKAEWIRRLRSGTYKQGHGSLKSADDKYCCLGVLCEMAVEDNIVDRVDYDTYVSKDNKKDANSSFLPEAVVNWSGLNGTDPLITGLSRYQICSLSMLNDSGYDFQYIADLIEKGLEEE